MVPLDPLAVPCSSLGPWPGGTEWSAGVSKGQMGQDQNPSSADFTRVRGALPGLGATWGLHAGPRHPELRGWGACRGGFCSGFVHPALSFLFCKMGIIVSSTDLLMGSDMRHLQ